MVRMPNSGQRSEHEETKMIPELKEIREIAKKADYGRIPVKKEIYADRYTPIEVMRTLRAASRHCYLLESAHKDEKWGRILANPGIHLHRRQDEDTLAVGRPGDRGRGNLYRDSQRQNPGDFEKV